MARELFDEVANVTTVNRVLWAMATLKRRFDFVMLRYLVENMRWLQEADYDALQIQLRELPFVKTDEEVSSHLLHDAVIEPIALVFKGIDGFAGLRDELFQTVVYEYYPQQIQTVESQDEQNYLQVEQLGYILDQDIKTGIEKYKTHLEEVQQFQRYYFEELLWGEIYEHMPEGSSTEHRGVMFWAISAATNPQLTTPHLPTLPPSRVYLLLVAL